MMNIRKTNSLKQLFIAMLISIFVFSCANPVAFAATKSITSSSGQSSLKLVSSSPKNGAKKVAPRTNASVKFSQPIKKGKNFKSIKLVNGKKTIPINLSISDRTLYALHTNNYAYGGVYTLKIPKGAITTTNSSLTNSDISITFTIQTLKEFNAAAVKKELPKEVEITNHDNPTDFMLQSVEAFNFFKENDPFLEISKTIMGFDLEKSKDDIIANLSSSETEYDFNSRLQGIISKFLPTHTHMITFNMSIPYEINFIYLNGEYLVIDSAYSAVKIGDIVTKIDNIPIDEYVKNKENMMTRLDIKRNKIYSPQSVFYRSDTLAFTIKNSSGVEDSYTVSMYSKSYDFNQAMQTAYEQMNLATSIIKDNTIAYLKVPTFMKSYEQEISGFIEKIKDYKYLIVDVRDNGGGYSSICKQLINHLITKPTSLTNYLCMRNSQLINSLSLDSDCDWYNDIHLLDSTEKGQLSILPQEVRNDSYKVYKVTESFTPSPTHFNGKIFILTNDGCFSATEAFCNRMKRIGAGTLVGGYTGGDGILLSPKIYPIGNNNNTAIKYSYVLGIQDDGTINQVAHTSPDFYVEQNKNDLINYINNRGDFKPYDTILNECLNIIENELN